MNIGRKIFRTNSVTTGETRIKSICRSQSTCHNEAACHGKPTELCSGVAKEHLRRNRQFTKLGRQRQTQVSSDILQKKYCFRTLPLGPVHTGTQSFRSISFRSEKWNAQGLRSHGNADWSFSWQLENCACCPCLQER